MRKLLILSLSTALFFLSVSECLASTLILKAQKEVKGSDRTELATVDVSKYNKVRIAIKYESADKNKTPVADVSIFTVEESDELYLIGNSYNFLIDTPPHKLKITAIGSGNYKIFIWVS